MKSQDPIDLTQYPVPVLKVKPDMTATEITEIMRKAVLDPSQNASQSPTNGR